MFGNHYCVSIKQRKGNYFIYVGVGHNPNNIPASAFKTNLGNSHIGIIKKVEKEVKHLLASYKTPKNESPFYFVTDLYWSRRSLPLRSCEKKNDF